MDTFLIFIITYLLVANISSVRWTKSYTWKWVSEGYYSAEAPIAYIHILLHNSLNLLFYFSLWSLLHWSVCVSSLYPYWKAVISNQEISKVILKKIRALTELYWNSIMTFQRVSTSILIFQTTNQKMCSFCSRKVCLFFMYTSGPQENGIHSK